MKFLQEENRKKLCNLIFYVALTIELLLMIYEKSELPDPGNFLPVFRGSFYSIVFRGTFILALAVVLLMKHNKREWIMLAAVFAFTFVCYRISGKNDLLRIFTFMAAARDVDLKKVMKYIFYVSLAGFGLIAILSVVGALGNIYQVTDYGRESAEELRYVFGFGHPNTLYGCVFALAALWIWIYGRTAGILQWLIALAINMGVCLISKTRTGLAISVCTFAIALLARYWNKLSEYKIIYILTTLVTPVFCAAFSIWAAIVSPVPRYMYEHKHYRIITFIDETLNNRMQDLYRATKGHEGAIETWRLFSDRNSVREFDMGWVRMFYWYGIIPTVIISILVIVLIIMCYRKRDTMTLVVILSLSIYTIVEATFVSRYIGRLFIFPVAAAYLWEFFGSKKEIQDA